MNNLNYPYGSQPPYPGPPNQHGYPQAQPGYPNAPSYPPASNAQYPNMPYSGASNPSRPFAPSPNPTGYPTQPGYGAPQPQAYPSQPAYAPGPSQAPYPGQQGYYPPPPSQPNQPNYPGYPPQNPGYQPYQNTAPGYGNQGYGNQMQWDERNYLRKIFDDIDVNRNGSISTQELHEALRRGQTNFDFDPFTVQYLMQKYDTNGNGQISFEEFYQLNVDLNVQYNEFLDIDQDMSGFVDSRELSNSLRRKGYNFSPEIFDFIVNEISRRSGKRGITFDLYVRVSARFDALRNEYNRMPYKNVPMDIFIRDRFF